MANLTGKKFGGRKKGTPNKDTADLRKFVSDLLSKSQAQIMADFKKLKPIERVTMFEKFLKYSLPALQASSLEINFEDLNESQLNTIIEKLIKKQDDGSN